jgi:AcrR family transcriptional regulator
MDVAEKLAVEAGAAAVTVRALSELTGVSNGAIYHAFGSRAGLVGRVWLRAAQQFLAVQRDAVDAALGGADSSGADKPGAAVEAVVVAADTPATFLLDQPVRGQFLLTVSRRELLGSDDLPTDLAAELNTLDTTLAELFITLSQAMWGRADPLAVSVIRDCVVELPTALLLRGRRLPEPDVRQRLTTAVRAVLTVPLPEPTPTRRSTDR